MLAGRWSGFWCRQSDWLAVHEDAVVSSRRVQCDGMRANNYGSVRVKGL